VNKSHDLLRKIQDVLQASMDAERARIAALGDKYVPEDLQTLALASEIHHRTGWVWQAIGVLTQVPNPRLKDKLSELRPVHKKKKK
jgi:hypothetical protein